MSRAISAVFADGVFRPLEPVDWPEGTHVQIQVQAPVEGAGAELSPEEIVRQAAAMPWPQFVERTYGSCAGSGLERPDQGDFERRDPIS